MRKRRKNHINPLKWIGWQLEIMPYYLRDRGAKPYELSAPELFLDIYAVCALLMLIPRKIRIFFKALIYIFLYGLAIVDMYCYVQNYLELSISARSNLILKEAGMPPVHDPANAARLQEMDVLRKRIGPTAELALRPIVDRNQVNTWAMHQLV